MVIKRGIRKLRGYFLNLFLIWGVFLVYIKLPYYINFIRPETIDVIFTLSLAYTIGGFFFYLFTNENKIKETKGEIIFNYLKRSLKEKKLGKLEHKEKTAVLFIAVKLFFVPIMLNFVFSNLFSIKSQIPGIFKARDIFSLEFFNGIFFPFCLAGIFLIDTAWFAFGYAAEAGFLRNKIISVESTFFGWVVAIICYPPFNSIFTGITNWYANDYITLSNVWITFILRVVVLLFLGIYLSATLALGTKCSNLTNRGIVVKGPYRFIRHPAYISKNLAWWVTVIPFAGVPAVLSMATWSLIYHFRSLTEERHLKKDPNYLEYCRKVKYRYIPGVY